MVAGFVISTYHSNLNSLIVSYKCFNKFIYLILWKFHTTTSVSVQKAYLALALGKDVIVDALRLTYASLEELN
jgi:hypothetical protein